jgi:hypothetical protein
MIFKPIVFTVTDTGENSAVLTVDEGSTYIYKLYLLANGEVLFTSPPFHDVKARE